MDEKVCHGKANSFNKAVRLQMHIHMKLSDCQALRCCDGLWHCRTLKHKIFGSTAC